MINFADLPYPMFETTPEEKEVLRKAELHYASSPYSDIEWFPLCTVICDLKVPQEIELSLLAKISESLEDFCTVYGYMRGHSYEFLILATNLAGSEDDIALRVLLRRFWIVKLLNYTGE